MGKIKFVKVFVHEDCNRAFAQGQIHTFPPKRWLTAEVWTYFLAFKPIITTSGVRGRHN